MEAWKTKPRRAAALYWTWIQCVYAHDVIIYETASPQHLHRGLEKEHLRTLDVDASA